MEDIYDDDFSALAIKATEACVWLKSLGIRYENTRFDTYLKRITEIQSHAIEGKSHHLDKRSDIYFDALYEFSDLSYAHQVFSGAEPAGLALLLHKLVKGPASTRIETEKNSTARNFSFEILMGARLAASGFNISFTTSGDVYADAPLPPVYIQCKRPRSVTSLKNKMMEAAKQLKVDLDNEGNKQAFGVIAIDATRLINPDMTMLYAPTRELSDDWHMRILNDFCTIYVEPIMMDEKLARHQSIIDVTVRFTAQWGIQNTRTIHYQHDLQTMHLPKLNLNKLNMAYYFNLALQQRATKFQNMP